MVCEFCYGIGSFIYGIVRVCHCCPNKLTTRTIFAIISFILATVDLSSDWVNYATFQSGDFSEDEHWNLQFVQPLLYITIASSILYVLEVSSSSSLYFILNTMLKYWRFHIQ